LKKGFAVQTIYLLLMSGVTVVILATMFDAIKAVSSKPIWEQTSPLAALVERRTQSLPYVGVERRKANIAEKVDVATTTTVVEQPRKVA
jgi:hypothetical protein